MKRQIQFTIRSNQWLKRLHISKYTSQAEMAKQHAAEVSFQYMTAVCSRSYKAMTHKQSRGEELNTRDLAYRMISITNEELLNELNYGGDRAQGSRIITTALKALESANLIAFYSPFRLSGKNNKRTLEVLWDPISKQFNQPFNLKQAQKNSPQGHLFLPEPIVVTTTPAVVTTTPAVVTTTRAVVTTTSKHDSKAKVGSRINILDAPVVQESRSQGSMVCETRPKLDFPSSKKHAPETATLLSFWETPGIKEFESLPYLMGLVIDHCKGEFGYDPSYLLEAENYRKIVVPDLNENVPLTFTPIKTTEDYCLRFLTLNRWEGTIKEQFMKNIGPNGILAGQYKNYEEAFKAYLYHSPRGIAWQHDPGAPWSSPLAPAVLYNIDETGREKAYRATMGKNPFERDNGFSTLELTMLFDQDIQGVDMSVMNPRFSRIMQWLCGNTGLSSVAIKDLYLEYKFEMENPTTLLGKINKTNTERGKPDDKLSHFLGYARGRQFANKGITFLKSTTGRWILREVGESLMDSEILGGEVMYLPDAKGNRAEVYMTSYQLNHWKEELGIRARKNIQKSGLLDKLMNGGV